MIRERLRPAWPPQRGDEVGSTGEQQRGMGSADRTEKGEHLTWFEALWLCKLVLHFLLALMPTSSLCCFPLRRAQRLRSLG